MSQQADGRQANPPGRLSRAQVGVLVRQATRGDQQAYRALYRLNQPYVKRVVTRILRAGPDVEDVVQDTFVAAFEGMERMTDKTAWRKWLVTIAVRSSIRAIRKRDSRREELLEVDLVHLWEPATSTSAAAFARDLQEALGKLPSDLRKPWISLRVEGRSLSQVAKQFDISLSTLKRRMAESDTRLRRRLAPHQDHESTRGATIRNPQAKRSEPLLT